MKDLTDIQNDLKRVRILADVARGTGLSYMTVWRIKEGKTDNITLDTLKKLNNYFERK